MWAEEVATWERETSLEGLQRLGALRAVCEAGPAVAKVTAAKAGEAAAARRVACVASEARRWLSARKHELRAEQHARQHGAAEWEEGRAAASEHMADELRGAGLFEALRPGEASRMVRWSGGSGGSDGSDGQMVR